MSHTLYPLLLEPAYRDYIWGGRRIPLRFDRALPPGIYAESWEVSDRAEGPSRIANGAWQGRTLAEVLTREGQRIAGTVASATVFPLLIKLIDARERLSVQVHPDDAQAAAGFGEAKTEAWHILEAPPGAQVFAGLRSGVTEPDFQSALRSNRLEDCLQAVPVAAGDTVFIPGGRVHAICEGLLLLEVQQNSNTTYRVYDWGRVGKDGRPRDLHLEQALRVIHWQDAHPVKTAPRVVEASSASRTTLLVACRYFGLEQLDLHGTVTVTHDGASFHALFTLSGAVDIAYGADTAVIPAGRTCLIPAALQRYTLTPRAPSARILRVGLPAPI